MTLAAFKATLRETSPPAVQPLLRALWSEARGDWKTAHEITQAIEGERAAWVHAYLHRKEGDLSNARYWYRRAERPEATDALDQEWERIVCALLTSTDPVPR